MTEEVRFTVRLSAEQADHLDEIAAAAGISRSMVVRRLIDEHDDLGAASSERLDRDGLLDLMYERARNGSTAAARYLLERQEAAAEVERLNALTRG